MIEGTCRGNVTYLPSGKRKRRGYAHHGGHENDERGKREISSTTPQEHIARAREICFRQLAMMERSTHQLIDSMLQRDIPEDIALKVVDSFQQAGYVDDLRFANALTRTRREGKGASRRAIAQELQRKGVGKEVIEQALAPITAEDELHVAIRFATTRLRKATGKPETLYRRTYAALARRGFDGDVCSKALRIAWASIAKEHSDSEFFTNRREEQW